MGAPEEKDWQTYLFEQGIKAGRILIIGVVLEEGKLNELDPY